MSQKRVSKSKKPTKRKTSNSTQIIKKKPYSIKTSITTKSGWISPDGKFYECVYWQHDELGESLAKKFYDKTSSAELETEGWIRFSRGDVLVLIDRDRFGRKKPFTNKHLDMFYDYLIKNNLTTLSFLIMEKISGKIIRNWKNVSRKDLYQEFS